MANDAKRVEIGFVGGQVASARLDEEALGALREALGAGEGWHEVAAEDGRLSIDVARVVFIRVERDEQEIGFRT
jgi:hypothetical protein